MNGVTISIEELVKLEKTNLNLAIREKALSSRAGGHHSNVRGRGMDFSEVRRYQAGDDVRHMQWKITAKTGKAHTKLYHEEKERPVFFICNMNPSMYFATQVAFKTVIAAKLSAMLAWHFCKKGDRIGGIIYSGNKTLDIRPRSRRFGVLNLLKALSEETQIPNTQTKPLHPILLQLRHVLRPGSLVFIISDFYDLDEACISLLNKLKCHSDLVGIRITDPIEKSIPAAGTYPIKNYDGDVSLLNLHQHKTTAAYQQCLIEHQKNIAKCFKAHRFFELCTNEDLITFLAQLEHSLNLVRAQ